MLSKYLLVAGAPGSKWSSVVKNIYWSEDLDKSDYNPLTRSYYHDAEGTGTPQLMHSGAYFDPMMEFGPERSEWDKPFSGNKTRLIKSHVFCEQLEELAKLEHSMVLVYRNDDACIDWWLKCGGFDITYPKYDYYENVEKMKEHICSQNKGIQDFISKHKCIEVFNNVELCSALAMRFPLMGTLHDYREKDIQVYVYKQLGFG